MGHRMLGVLIILVLTACLGGERWTEISSIPHAYFGEYRLVNSYVDHVIEVRYDGIYDVQPYEFNDELREYEGVKFFEKPNWNSEKHTAPIKMCLDESCERYIVINARLENGVLLVRHCLYYSDYGEQCELSEFIRL